MHSNDVNQDNVQYNWLQNNGHPLTTSGFAEKWQVIFNLSLPVEHMDSHNRLGNLRFLEPWIYSTIRKYPKASDITVSDNCC